VSAARRCPYGGSASGLDDDAAAVAGRGCMEESLDVVGGCTGELDGLVNTEGRGSVELEADNVGNGD
jgi:hypothetical protein